MHRFESRPAWPAAESLLARLTTLLYAATRSPSRRIDELRGALVVVVQQLARNIVKLAAPGKERETVLHIVGQFDTQGAAGELSLNGNGDDSNGVDQADYALWADNFNNTPGAGSAVSVPESTSLVLLLVRLAATLFSRR